MTWPGLHHHHRGWAMFAEHPCSSGQRFTTTHHRVRATPDTIMLGGSSSRPKFQTASRACRSFMDIPAPRANLFTGAELIFQGPGRKLMSS